MGNMGLTRALLLLGLAAYAGLIATKEHSKATTLLVARALPTVQKASVRSDPDDGTYDRYGGEQPKLQIALYPDAVVVNGGKETIEYHAELTSEINKAANVAWTVLLVDDVGNVVQTLDTGVRSVATGQQIATPTVQPGVVDGYYALQVRAVIHSSEGDYAAEEVQYLVVENGKMREMTFDDWHDQSRDCLETQVSATSNSSNSNATSNPAAPSETGGGSK